MWLSEWFRALTVVLRPIIQYAYHFQYNVAHMVVKSEVFGVYFLSMRKKTRLSMGLQVLYVYGRTGV